LQETIEWYLSSDTLLGFASLVIDDGAALPAAGGRVTREMQERSLDSGSACRTCPLFQGQPCAVASLGSVGIPAQPRTRCLSSLSAMNVPVSSFCRLAKRQTTEAMAWQRRRFALFAPVLSWFGRFEIRTRKVMMSTVREESSLPPPWSRWKLLLNQSSPTCAYQ
jgi:hypothetical protein